MWASVDRLVDRAPRLDDLVSHELHLFAAQRWQLQGRPVPAPIVEAQRASAVKLLSVRVLLQRVRDAHNGALLVFKGPEVAARYPDPVLRPYVDVDFIAADPEGAYADLLAAGAVPVGDPARYVDIHHLRPLAWPDLPLAVEIHEQPKWVDGLPAPSTSDILATAVAARVGVDGFLAPAPAQHALLLAAHSWAHEPFRSVRDLIDVAVLAAEAGAEETVAAAKRWDAGDLWSATADAAAALFAGAPPSLPMRTWAKNLTHVRGRTVLEGHLERWSSDFWVLPFGTALRRLPSTLAREVAPRPGETWSDKVGRSSLAVRNALRRRTDHDDALDDVARR